MPQIFDAIFVDMVRVTSTTVGTGAFALPADLAGRPPDVRPRLVDGLEQPDGHEGGLRGGERDRGQQPVQRHPLGPGVLFLHNDLTPCWRAASPRASALATPTLS